MGRKRLSQHPEVRVDFLLPGEGPRKRTTDQFRNLEQVAKRLKGEAEAAARYWSRKEGEFRQQRIALERRNEIGTTSLSPDTVEAMTAPGTEPDSEGS